MSLFPKREGNKSKFIPITKKNLLKVIINYWKPKE